MSKKKRTHKIRLEIGKFYRVLDGSPGGHPGQIYSIDTNDKSFYAVVTGSMSFDEFRKLGLRKGYIKLTYPTDSNVDISLIKKRPFVGDRDDYGDKEYLDMLFNSVDVKIILEIQKKKPIKGSYYKKRRKIKKASEMRHTFYCGSASNIWWPRPYHY